MARGRARFSSELDFIKACGLCKNWLRLLLLAVTWKRRAGITGRPAIKASVKAFECRPIPCFALELVGHPFNSELVNYVCKSPKQFFVRDIRIKLTQQIRVSWQLTILGLRLILLGVLRLVLLLGVLLDLLLAAGVLNSREIQVLREENYCDEAKLKVNIPAQRRVLQEEPLAAKVSWKHECPEPQEATSSSEQKAKMRHFSVSAPLAGVKEVRCIMRR